MARRLCLLLLVLAARPARPSRDGSVLSAATAFVRDALASGPVDMSLYDALDVASNATSGSIAAAYRAAALRLHPDKMQHGQDAAAAVGAFHFISEAGNAPSRCFVSVFCSGSRCFVSVFNASSYS